MKEIRKLDMQFRAEPNDEGKMEIKGYAVVFNSPETYDYTEVIDEHALDETDMSDVVLRYNHNDSFMVLARTRNHSLQLEKDNTGLMIDATLQDDITDHRNIYNAIKSGLIDKQSFAFSVDEDDYDYDTDTRTIKKIGKLYDVSVVDQPFYNATDVSIARDQNNEFLTKRNELRKQHEEELEIARKKEELNKRKQEILAKLG